MKRVLASLACAVSLSAVARDADHLLISEVAYNTVNDTATNFIEVHNPTASAVALDAYFVSDEPRSYFQVVRGRVDTRNVILQFPAGASIPPGGRVVVTEAADPFLREFFGGSLEAFQGQAGNPQLFERRETLTTVPNMVAHTLTNNVLNLRTTGDAAILFWWDGAANLVRDVDIVVWLSAAEVPNKTGQSNNGVSYAQDLPSTLLGGATTAGTHSLQRKDATEPNERPAGGNGLTGHDETSEDWTTLVNARATPGACLIQTFFRDADGDKFGNPNDTVSACAPPAGYVVRGGDCDDRPGVGAGIHPGAIEICDGIDQDCDGLIDEDAGPLWYRDGDGDGFGDPKVSLRACTRPAGYVDNAQDCNDTTAQDSPVAPEVCDGRDNDCDGLVDEDVKGTFYLDADGDGFGGPTSVQACSAPPGHVANALDCDDTRPEVFPAPRELVCRDGLDNDCDGLVDAKDPDCARVPDLSSGSCGGCAQAGAALPALALVALVAAALRRRRPRGQ